MFRWVSDGHCGHQGSKWVNIPVVTKIFSKKNNSYRFGISVIDIVGVAEISKRKNKDFDPKVHFSDFFDQKGLFAHIFH